jgi:Na+/H+ antiporter NhaB
LSLFVIAQAFLGAKWYWYLIAALAFVAANPLVHRIVSGSR